MVNRGSFWGEAPFQLLQPVLLGVLTGLVWMLFGIFACRTNVWYFMAMAFGFAELLGILTWLFGLMFVLVIGSERTYA